MDQKFIDLFDRYTHGAMKRREFLEKLTLLAGGTAAVSTILPILENNYAQAEMVPEDDPALRSGFQEIDTGVGGYLSFPLEGDIHTAVLVIHENRGLNPHIKDVTRRLAKEGFVAFGADYLYAMGGTPEDADKARDMIGTLKPEDILALSRRSLIAIAQACPVNPATIGAIGFCWGGGPGKCAGGRPIRCSRRGWPTTAVNPPAADVPKINAPLLLHYAGLDERINARHRRF